MREIEMLENGLIPTDLLGNLNIKTVILEYDYPRCFIAQNEKNKYFALLENEDNLENFGWNVSEVSLKDINNVNRGEKNVQSLFIDKKSYLLSFNLRSNIGKIQCVDYFTGKNAIMGNLFVKDFCEMDEVFDFHKLQYNSNITNKSSISVVLDSNKGTKTSVILKTINYVKNICKNLKNEIDISSSEFLVQHASTVITFQFDNNLENSIFSDGDIFDGYNSGILELGNLLSANEPEEILLEAKDINIVNKYSKLIDTLKEEAELRPKVIIASPKNENVASFDFGYNSYSKKKKIVSQACKMIKDNNKIEESEVVEKGVLTGVLTGNNNKFSFKCSNGKVYSGTVDFSLVGNDKQFLVNGAIYLATIKSTKVYNQENLVKESYKLIKLEILEKIYKQYQDSILDNL